MKAYLAGAIEYAPDLGKKWRSEISVFLDREMNHANYNPLLEENKYLTKNEQATFRDLKVTDTNKYRIILRKLIDGDLKTLKESIDYIICLWDNYAEKGGGTYGELTVGYEQNIPIYMVTEKLKPEISGWILGCTSFKVLMN